MSEPTELPTESDTPDDHEVVAITIEPGLLPDWFEAVRTVSAAHARRLAVIQKPDGWIVKVELPKSAKAKWGEELTQAWEAFVAGRRAAGTWDD